MNAQLIKKIAVLFVTTISLFIKVTFADIGIQSALVHPWMDSGAVRAQDVMALGERGGLLYPLTSGVKNTATISSELQKTATFEQIDKNRMQTLSAASFSDGSVGFSNRSSDIDLRMQRLQSLITLRESLRQISPRAPIAWLQGKRAPNFQLSQQAAFKISTEQLGEDLFIAGMQAWNAHDYDVAVDYFLVLLKRFPRHKWSAEAWLHLGCYARFLGMHRVSNIAFLEVARLGALSNSTGGRFLMEQSISRLAIQRVLENAPDVAREYFSVLANEAKMPRLRRYASHWILRLSHPENLAGWRYLCAITGYAALLEKLGFSEAAGRIKSLVTSVQSGDKTHDLLEVLQTSVATAGTDNSTENLSPELAKHLLGGRGMSLDKLTRFSEQMGLPLSTYRLSVQALKQVWQQTQKPMMLLMPGYEKSRGHIWVLESISEEYIQLLDSQSGRRIQQPLKAFQYEWDSVLLTQGDLNITRTTIDNTASIKSVSGDQLNTLSAGCCGIQRPESSLGPVEGLNGLPTDDTVDSGGCSLGAPSYAINPLNLNIYLTDTPIWYTPSYGPDFRLDLHYNSQSALAEGEIFGSGWQFGYGSYLVQDPGGVVTLFMPSGRRDVFVPSETGDGFDSPDNTRNILEKLDDGFRLHLADGGYYEYGIPDGVNTSQWLLLKIVDAHDQALTLIYDDLARLIAAQDALGKTTTFSYNSNNLVEAVTDPFGRSATFDYETRDGIHYLMRVTDMGGYESTLDYDENGYVSLLGDKLGTTLFYTEPADGIENDLDAYPPPGEPMWEDYRVTVTHPDKTKSEYYFDGYYGKSIYFGPAHYVDYVDRETNNYKQAKRTAEYYYERVDGRPRYLTRVEYYGQGADYFEHENGLLSQYQDKRGLPIEISYDDAGSVQTFKDWLGHETKLTWLYDADYPQGRIKTIATPLGDTHYDYTENSLSVTNPLGERSAVYWDNYGRVTKEIDALGQETIYEYGQDGYLAVITKSGKTLSTLTHDRFGRLQTLTDYKNRLTKLEYDDLNQVIEITDADGVKRTRAYDTCAKKLTSETFRNGVKQNITYGPSHRVRSIDLQNTAQEIQSLQFNYAKDGALEYTLDAAGSLTKHEYGADRLLKYTTHGAGQILGQLTADLTEGLEAREPDFEYEHCGTERYLCHIENATGGEIRISRDSNQRLSYIRASVPGQSGAYFIRDVKYDDYNRVMELEDLTGKHQFEYDALSRLVVHKSPQGDVTISYDAIGRISQYTVKSTGDFEAQRVVHYTYDAIDRLQTVVHKITADGQTKTQVFRYSDDDEVRAHYLHYPGSVQMATHENTVGLVTKRVLEPQIAAKKVRQKSSVLERAPPLFSADFTYENDLLKQTTKPVPWIEKNSDHKIWQGSADIDSRQQLHTFTHQNTEKTIFEYDALGRVIAGELQDRRAFTAKYNAFGQLAEIETNAKQAAPFSDAHFFAGKNLAEKTVQRNAAASNTAPIKYTLTYRFDGLLSSIKAVSDGKTQSHQVFHYGPLGELLSITDDILNTQSAYVYGRANHHGQGSVLGVYQATENAGAAYSVITDRLGNVIGLLDDQGHVQGKKSYAAYGEILSETGNISRLGFAGQYDLGDTGILLFEGRPYMPWIGRFMRPDPLGLLGAHFSELYAYGAGDPINNTDPDGRIAIVGAIANVAIGYGIAVASGCEYSVQSAMIDAALGFVGAGLVGKAAKFVRLPGKNVTNGTTTVIGRVKDLQKLKKNERSLLDRLPDLGNPKANWKQNSGVLRQEIAKGKPIRDASPGNKQGQFLNAERNLLENRGWIFDKSSNMWNPPK